MRDLTVGPLALRRRPRLALALLGSGRRVRAAERRGHRARVGREPVPASRSSRAAQAPITASRWATRSWPVAQVSLDQMLASRVARLPDEARRLLELIAVGGRPLPVTTVGAAAEASDGDAARRDAALAQVRARRSARWRRGRRGDPRPHPRDHRRAARRADVTREHHGRLARVLEATPDADPEALASHLLGAGDKERAARLRGARGGAGGREARVRPGCAPLRAHPARRSARRRPKPDGSRAARRRPASGRVTPRRPRART